MCLKQARTAPSDCSGGCTGRLGRREEPFVPYQTLEHPQMISFLVTLYLMISWAGILNALSIV